MVDNMKRMAKAFGVVLSIVFFIAYNFSAMVLSILMFFAFSSDTLTKYIALWRMRLSIF
jgi:hypothetical protein